MRIAICGASGFVGSHLTEHYTSRHVTVTALSKSYFAPDSFDKLVTAIMGCDIIINLAGVNLNHRWDDCYKEEIYNSRIETTRTLVNAINSLKNKPSLFISTSAVGYYSSKGVYKESNAVMGDNFLSSVCHQWEEQARRVSIDVRCVITRFGIVLSNDGGAFPKMIQSTKFGVMTKIGSGSQFMSWIGIHDLMRAFDFIIARGEICGVVNLCTPNPISNSDFAHLIAKKYNCKITVTIPPFVLRVVMGESSMLLTEGQNVYPERLLKYGYKFNTPTMDDFLKNLII